MLKRSFREPATPARTVSKFTLTPKFAEQLWNKMLEAGDYGEQTEFFRLDWPPETRCGSKPAMSLYGHELSDDITPLEANLGWITKLQKGDFIGRESWRNRKKTGLTRRLVGFEMIDRGIARDGYDVYIDGEKVGYVTSGSPAPFLKKEHRLCFCARRICKCRSGN